MSNPIYLALDVPRLRDGVALAEKVKAHVGGIKLGLEFFCAHGAHGVHMIGQLGLPIFLAAAPAIAARLGEEFSAAPWMIWSWLFLLGFAALLSAVTAIQYLTGSAKPAEA